MTKVENILLDSCPFCKGEVELWKCTKTTKCRFICKECKVEVEFPQELDAKNCIKKWNERNNESKAVIGIEESEEGFSETMWTMCMEGPNQFQTVSYKPICLHGYTDCVWDPAYIHATYPIWYKKLCGDTLPEENPCEQCPNGERYDDEDK